MKTISIITTIYNPSIEGLTATLNSVLAQNYEGIVHYLYNDGSKDRMFLHIVDKYIEDVKRLKKPYKVIFIDCKENVGVDRAHFKCFEMVNSDYFMWLDCSDYLENNFFNKISNFLDLHYNDYHLYHFNSYQYFGESIAESPTSKSFVLSNLKNQKQFTNFLSKTNWFWHTFLVKTDVYKTINPSFYFIDKQDHGGFFYDAQVLWALCLADCDFYFFDDVYSYIEKPLSSVSTGYKYEHNIIHKVMIDLLTKFDLKNKVQREKQTFAFFENRSIYKKILVLKRKDFRKTVKENMTYYKDKELLPILFPKKQITKLLFISSIPFLYTLFVRKHRKEIEERLYFY